MISCDNSLPHLLTEEDLTLALRSIRRTLTADGLFIASIRDYDRLLVERPTFVGANVQGASKREVISFQVLDWSKKSDIYLTRLFIVTQTPNGWQVRELRTRYRAIRRKDLTLALESAGFTKIAWHTPEQSGYFQPIVTAHA